MKEGRLLPEQLNALKMCLDVPPAEGFGWSVEAVPKSTEPDSLLARFREVWQVVAQWGRWSDEDLGDWKSDELVAQLPAWFLERLSQQPSYDVENWMEDLHDRAWRFAGGCRSGDGVRFDLFAESLPLSSWPLRFVVELCRGEIAYDGVWKQVKVVAPVLGDQKWPQERTIPIAPRDERQGTSLSYARLRAGGVGLRWTAEQCTCIDAI